MLFYLLLFFLENVVLKYEPLRICIFSFFFNEENVQKRSYYQSYNCRTRLRRDEYIYNKPMCKNKMTHINSIL